MFPEESRDSIWVLSSCEYAVSAVSPARIATPLGNDIFLLIEESTILIKLVESILMVTVPLVIVSDGDVMLIAAVIVPAVICPAVIVTPAATAPATKSTGSLLTNHEKPVGLRYTFEFAVFRMTDPAGYVALGRDGSPDTAGRFDSTI